MGGQQHGAPFQCGLSSHGTAAPLPLSPLAPAKPVAQVWGLIQPNPEQGVEGEGAKQFGAPFSPSTLGPQGGVCRCHAGMAGTLPV